jgi:hypothetical protein
VIRCLAMYFVLLRALAPAGMCLPSRCLAIDLYVTISIYRPPSTELGKNPPVVVLVKSKHVVETLCTKVIT